MQTPSNAYANMNSPALQKILLHSNLFLIASLAVPVSGAIQSSDRAAKLPNTTIIVAQLRILPDSSRTTPIKLSSDQTTRIACVSLGDDMFALSPAVLGVTL